MLHSLLLDQIFEELVLSVAPGLLLRLFLIDSGPLVMTLVIISTWDQLRYIHPIIHGQLVQFNTFLLNVGHYSPLE